MARLGFFVTILAANVFLFAGDDPPPKPALMPVTDNVDQLMSKTPLVYVDGEPVHFKGQFLIIAYEPFELSALAPLDPSVELIYDQPSPAFADVRHIFARADEGEVDRIVAELRAMPHVIEAGRNSVATIAYQPPDYSWPRQRDAGLGLMNLPAAWDKSMGAPVEVAVIDTGVDPIGELQGRLRPGFNATEFVDDGDTSDDFGHGTMVASIIAARTNAGNGVIGIAPEVSLVPVRACTQYLLSANCPKLYVQNALDWLLSRVVGGENIQVVNMSFGGDDGVTYEYQLQMLASRGVILVASAGNNGKNGVEAPARVDEVVAVSGVVPGGSSRHPNSNYGQDLDVAAPFEAFAVDRNGVTQAFDGTSASAAIISGVAALFKSTQAVDRDGQQWNASDTEVFLYLIERSNPQQGWNAQTGRGVPDVYTTIWRWACQRMDFNGDDEIGISDMQAISFRYGAFFGSWRYQTQFDLDPFPTIDYDIDIKDLQTLFGRAGSTCPS